MRNIIIFYEIIHNHVFYIIYKFPSLLAEFDVKITLLKQILILSLFPNYMKSGLFNAT